MVAEHTWRTPLQIIRNIFQKTLHKENEELRRLTLEPSQTLIGFFLHWEYVTKLGHQQMTPLHIYSWKQEVVSSIGDRTLLDNTTADNLKHILEAST